MTSGHIQVQAAGGAMRTKAVLLVVCVGMGFCAHAFSQTRISASYAISAESFDAGGTAITSANYAINASASPIAAARQSSSSYAVMGGYSSQLYNVVGLQLNPSPASVNAGQTLQLGACEVLDDNTLIAVAPVLVSWGVASGPVSGITIGGLATAEMVYGDATAQLTGSYGGFSGLLYVSVINSAFDSWQTQYFGSNNPNSAPNVDADGTGQTNLFKYIAGLSPTNPASRFVVSIQPVPGVPGQKQIVFSPVVAGRTYTVISESSLANSAWVALSGTTQSDSGQQRTVTDLNATGSRKFYRVQISMP